MDANDSIEARNQRLRKLRTTNPAAWAICIGKRGPKEIAKVTGRSLELTQANLKVLRQAGHIRLSRYMGHVIYKPHSTELKRLNRRAYALRKRGEPLE